MRRAPFATAFALALFATAAAAQPYPGVFGIYDDAAMTRTSGTMNGPFKDVYVGWKLDGTPGFTGWEFAIAGLEPFPTTMLHWPVEPIIVVGTIAAPSDTIAGSGGINVAWPTCVVTSQAFLRLSLVAPVPPHDQVLRIVRHYPPSNPNLPFPFAVGCDAPCLQCLDRPQPGSYVLNPGVAAEPRSWGAIKQIYR